MDLVREPELRSIYIVTVFFMLAWDVFMVLTPIYGAQQKISASHIGFIISVYSMAVFAVRFFIKPLSRRFTNWQVLLMALVLAGTSTLGYGMVSAVPLLALLAFLIGCGQGLGGPLANATLYDVAPPARANEAMGLRMSILTACQTVLPLIAGAAGSLIGIAPLLWLSALGLFSGAWMLRG